MKSIGLELFAAVTWIALGGFLAAAQAGETLTSQAFVDKAGQAGMAEVETGRAALSKTQDSQVREFANHMVQDHSKAGAELTAAAKAAHITAPTKLDSEHQAAVDALGAKSGEAFDAAYSQQMVSDHEKAIALFQSAANSDELDPALVAFARKTLPTLQAHKGMADTLSASQRASADSTQQ
jgi:putative membrane protein